MDEAEFEGHLKRLRRLGADHSTCEVKKSQGGLPVSMWETISAFANAQGGTIILGVDEKHDFAVVGVRDPRAIESALGSVCHELEPTVRADIHTLFVQDKSVVIAEIPPVARDQRPCHKRSLGPWAGSRLRVSDGDRKLTDYEISVLLANRAEQRYDVSPVPLATIADLDERALAGLLGRIRDTRGVIFGTRDDTQVLMMLNVLTSHEGNLVPTLGGLLAFGVYPQQYEPQLNLTVVAYPTTNAGDPGPRGERFNENRAVDGSIPIMVVEAIRILKRNMRRRSVVSGLFRTDEWEYPEEVLREAIVNSLVHRDYSEFARGMQVQVELYPDRLVVRNPGGLYGPVEITSLGTNTISSSRNRGLLKILEDTPLGDGHMVCENRGTGIARMRSALTEAGMEAPTFIDDIGIFQAEFPNHTLLDQEAVEWLTSLDGTPLTRAQMTALVLMRNGNQLTNNSFRSATGVQDSRTAYKELKELVDRGLIDQYGTRGSTYYELAISNSDIDDYDEDSPADEDGDDSRNLTDLQRQVYAVLKAGRASRRDIIAQTGLESTQVIQILRALRRRDLVTMIGQPRSKNTIWRAL
ncbi:MAG: ATP-binding protein [Streptosporangiaceae bacterium]|jgi:ATP-dependent DNA helicase RecG